jgi:uncharacterized protein with GYD domain
MILHQEETMNQFLLEISYTPEAIAALVANPQDRREAVRPVIERLGGTMDNAWFAFGECDIVLIASFPDHVSALALSATLSAGGALRSVKTIPLIGIADGVEALRKAGSSGYTPVTKAADA